jgi:copper(I)-binding protein
MRTLVAAALAVLASAPAAACADLVVADAWIREAPPGAMSVAYAKLTNRGKRAVTLTGAGLHRTIIVDGMARMREGTLEIAPGAHAALEPGGWHLMLFDPARILKAGDVVQVALTCGTDERMHPFTVKAAAE